MQGAIALSPETQELLRSKPSKLTQLTQEQIDILKNWPEASRDLYHASQNAKRLLDDANLDDTLAWNAAEALKNIYIDATGNDIYRGREWRNFNEANQDFANGREALQRFYDIVSGTAKGDPRDPKVQAAALIGEENRAIMQEMAAWEKSYRESLSEKQANLEAQYRNDPGFFAELDEYAREKKIQETAQGNIDLGVQQARRRWLTEKAKQMGFYPEKVENDPYYDQLVADEDEAREAAKYARAIDPRQPYQRLVPAIPKEMLEAAKAAKRRKDYEPIAKDNIAYNALMTRLAQNAAFSQFVEIADTLNQSEREIILRAFDAGKEGIDINSHEGGKTWEELGLPEPENRAVADILGGRDAYYQTLPNVALASNIDPAHEETVRNLISLARGRVEDPQFFTDLWNRLVASTDRTFGNVPRFIDAMAKDLTVGAYNYFADEDLYANYTAQARAEAIQEAKWDAATAPLYYEPGYGWFGDGIIGITEQLPIWGVLAAGGTAKALSSGTIPGVEIAMGVLALGYAEDTRQQLLIDGADPLTALVAGATSGVVQSWLERAQAETLIGKGWSGNLLAVASRDIRGTVANAFYKRTLKEFGTWQFAQAAFRFGGGMAISGFQEAVQEGLQAGADRFISDLALKDPNFERALKASVDEFVATLPMMMMTAGLGGTVRVTRDVSSGASVGKQLRILTGQGIVGKEAEAALTSIGKTMDVADLREAWRNASNDRARIKLLMDVGHLPKTQATALHAYLVAEEKIADRHDALAMELAIDMSNEGAKTFANNPEAIRRVMTAIGLRNVQVEAAAIGSLNADNSKNERDGWRVTADVGNGRTVTFTVGVMTEQESTLDGSAATASSAWEYLKNSEAIQKELKGMTQEQFTERWMSDAAWRQALIKEYNMARRGESLILRKDSPYIVTEYTTPDGKTRKRKVSAAGAILIATGDHGRRVQAANKTLAHETVHAIVGLLRDTGVLTPETVKALRKEYGDPAHGVDELFNEEVFADALMTEAGYGLEMLERAAGEATRRKQDAVARALRGIADLFMGGGDFVLSRGAEGNITGLTISENADRGASLARYRNRAVLNSLRPLAQQAADIYNATERARSLGRLGRIRQGIHERIAKRREEAAKQAETEAERQQRDDELMARVDSDLSQMAEEAFALAQTELNATRVDIEQAAADIREAFSVEGYDPKDDTAKARLVREQGRKLIAHWRALKNRELELLRELADLNIDPSARREYLIARENEAHRLQGRAAREALDAEKRRINETPVADGDTLLANTRAIGHVTIESRESYIKRQMAEHGWDRKTAISQATHLYPENMEDLRAPWANRQLYGGRGSHSPDTAAQALYDEGRIADPTVDAFWDAVRGDIEVVSKAKDRDIAAAEAETASALEWGKERHAQTLADIEARSSIGGFVLSERARAEMDEVRRQYEGTDQWMKAPNGKPTKLTRRLWLLVRTPAFKRWFGDWENDPANASKVVDENGEPLVVYHGSENAGFTTFDSDYWDEGTLGNFTSSEVEIAETYSGSSLLIRSDMGQGKRQGNYALFLNIRNPLIVDAQGNYWDEIPPENRDDYVGAVELTDEQLETLAERAGVDEELERDEDGELTWQGRNDLVEAVESAYAQDVYDSDGWPTGETESPIFNSETLEATSEHRIADSTRKIANRTLKDGTGYDGVIFRDIVDIGPHSRPFFRRESDVFVTKGSTQLKSATDNVGNFDPENPDIRSSISGVGRGARAAGLYFGRSPTQADIASRAIIEAGLFATGRKQSANKVIEAYRDIGVTISPEDAAEVADRINTNLEEQKTARARRVKPGEEPRDKVFTLDAILAQAYDENWKKAEKDAFTKGVSGTFGAARQMAQDVQEAMEARRKEAEAVTGTAPAIIETELGFDIEASLLAAPEQIKTKVEIGKQQKQTEEERKAALEEARREDEASGPDGVAPEPTVEQMGFTESKLDEYHQKRRELRERSRKVEEEYEEKRKEAKKKYQKKETDDKQNAKEEEDNYLEFCESLRVSLNGIAFDLDNPPSVREFVNCMIHLVAEQRAGKKITRLRELREAFADPLVVRDAARTLAQIAEDLANRLVPSAARELIVKKAMTLAAAETIGQVRALATGALLSIRNVRIRQGRTELRDAMVKMIQSVKGRGRTVVGKEDSERKVSGDLERWLEDIERALTLGEAALESMRTAAYATIVGLSEHGKTQKELVDFRDYMKAMRTISAIDKFGSWRHMTLAGLDDLRVELERMINGGLEAHERKMRQMEAKIDGFVQPLIDAMTQNAPDFKPDENAPLRERIANALDRHLGLQSLLFEALIGKSTGETRQKAQRAVRDILNEFSAASAKYEATLLAWRAEIQDIIIRNYGSTRAFMERMHTPVPEDLRAHLTNRRTDAQEQAGREARQKTRITYGQALQLYASLVQRDYAQNARIHHRDGADFDALRRNLTDADVAFVAECSRFMKRIFPDLQAEYAEVTGVTVGTTPNYWPVKIDYPQSGLSAEVRAWTPIVAAMEPRRRNGLDFKEEVSAEQMLFSRLDEWARMLAYGKLGIISAAVFGNGDVINAIKNSLGTKMALRIQENIKTALMGPATKGDNFVILSTRWASAFAMAANAGVAFKQFAGIPNFALKLGTKETVAAWWGGVTRLADDEWDADWAILTASDSYKARYGGAGLNAEMRAALQGATPGAVGDATAKAYDFGFKLQSVADRVVAKPFAIHAFRMYREAYLREGLPAAEAQRRAVIDAWALVEDTQQSARPENQLQAVNTSRIVRMLTQFRSAQLQQLQWEMRAWAAFLRGEEGAKQKLARVIFINHILAPLFWTAFDALWQAALGLLGPGDEDDEEKMERRRERRLEMWISDLALGAILGQLTAVPVLGGSFVAVYNRIVSNMRRRAEGKEPKPITTTEIVTEVTDVPAIRSAADIMATVYNLGLAATEVEMRDVASEADDFLKTAIPPYRDISKGAEQWGLGDLDNLWEEEE